MAYVIDDGLGTSTYKLFIQTDGDFIYANPNSAGLFRSFTVLTLITNIDLLDTSKVTTTNVMFAYSSALTSLDLSSFDVSKVVNMNGMMYHCSGLTSLIIGNFNSISVTDMSLMFGFCSNLTTLDLSNFVTSSVVNMATLFLSFEKLNNIDISNFDTSKVTNMTYMFFNCSLLTNLDLRNANFTLANSKGMFSNITSGINIVVKDSIAQTWITARLTQAGRTGNVTIYVP